MIGYHQIVIGSAEWTKGMSSSSDISDGGFSNETDAVNLTYNPGVIYASAIAVDSDTDTRLTGNIIATSPDMERVSANNRLLVADNDTYYKYNGTKIIAAAYTGGTGSTTAAGFTDIVTYRGEGYVSCKERIKRWQSNNTITDLGSFSFSDVPHPMIVYENNFYAGDGNLLLQATAVNTMPTTILTLDVNQIIIAIGIDPGNGLMLISTVSTVDTSDTLPTISKLLWYDGNSLKVTKSVITEDTILGFHTNSGVTYVGYGKNLGYINGSGITFLRDLKNVTNVQAELPYKHHFASIANTVYVLDGLQILAYGEVLTRRKVFYYCFKNNTNSNKPTAMGYGGNGKLVFGFATTKFYSVDTNSIASTNTLSLISNKYEFPRPVFLRGFYVEYADAISANDNNRSLSYKTEAQGAGFILIKETSNTFSALKNLSSASVYFLRPNVSVTSDKISLLQLKYTADTLNAGLRRIIIYYDIADPIPRHH